MAKTHGDPQDRQKNPNPGRRRFLIAATMLHQLGVGRVRLLTNNPDKVAALAACGIAVEREPHAIAPNGVNDRYLATKAARFGHLLDEG